MTELLRHLVGNFSAHGCMTHGAALAFYALFVLVPIPIFVVSGAATLVGDDLARAEVVEAVRVLTGDPLASTLEAALETASKVTDWRGANLFALASLLFGSAVFFSELVDILNKIWGIPAQGFRWQSFVRSRLVSFAMVVSSGAVLLLLTLAGTLVRTFGERLASVVPLPAWVFGAGGLLASAAVIAAMFGLVFRYAPEAESSWGDVWLGALVTGALFVGGSELIGVYLRYTSLATTYGAAGSLVLTLIWIYYSALAFLFGAELTRLLARAPRESTP